MTSEEMQRAVAGIDATAAKVRALHDAGAGVGEIRRFLDISYQHAYNVLLRSGAIQKKSGRADAPAPSGDRDEIRIARADASGAVKFDEDVMNEFAIRPGGEVFCRRTSEGILLIGRDAALEQLTEIAKAAMPDQVSILEALLKGGNQST